jgi:hypothetical protein
MPYRLLTVQTILFLAAPNPSLAGPASPLDTIPIPSAPVQTEIHQVGVTLLYLLHIRFVNTRYNMFCKLFT